MTIYTLYKKTHLKTGLKYLGYTKQNPFTYKGSGKLWQNHINAHGYEVDTEILFQTENKKDIKPVGIYYSNLWNVVESKDWANLKSEEGDGGAIYLGDKHHTKTDAFRKHFSKNNPMRNKDIAIQFTGENNNSKKASARKKISEKLKGIPKSEKHKANMYNPMLDPKVSGKRKGKNNPGYNPTVYCWEHMETKEQLFLTQYDFQQQVGGTRGHINNVVSGRSKSVKGYSVIKMP